MNNAVIHLGPTLGEAAGAVILIHGRGSSGRDIVSLAEAILTKDVAWLAPTASEGSWYPQRFLVPLKQNEPWLGRALQTIDELVLEANAAGIPSERIGLVGFSQGACLALEYAIRHPRRYGFIGGLSGAVIGPLETPRPEMDLHETPVLLACAEHDGHIPFAYVEHSHQILSRANATVTLQKYPGSAHTVFPEEIAWLEEQIRGLHRSRSG